MAQKKKRFFRRKQQLPNMAFIDAQNLNRGTQKSGWKMNWKEFRVWLKQNYKVEKAYMFIGYVPNNESLYKQMQEAGYIVVLKPTVDMLMTEEELKNENHVTKGNADAEMVLYAVKEVANYNQAVVVSGDGDFYCLVEYLKEKNKLKKILVPNHQYSSLYKDFQDYVHVLEQDRKQLMYDRVRKPKKRVSNRKPSSKR